MGLLNAISLGMFLLAISTSTWACNTTMELKSQTDAQRNESAEGFFNMPDSDLSNETVLAFYNVVSTSDGNDTVGLSLRYVPSIGYGRPHPFGYCNLHGSVWAIHHVPGYFFWPPIPKRVCDRPCWIFGRRCRPALRKILCIRRYVWWCSGFQCIPHGVQSVYYEYHYYCKSSYGFNSPYCYL